jgi:benzoyl-CoA reductase/2-hydroxyglutaryl-CoA dehydratase subunit BcrC/BadD/HgdB
MHVMDVPQMKRPEDIERWAHEIEIFAGVVEEQTGNKVTVENLNEAINIINNKRKALKRVYDARKADKLPISGKDALLMM